MCWVLILKLFEFHQATVIETFFLETQKASLKFYQLRHDIYLFWNRQNLKFLFSLTSKTRKPPDFAAHSTANFRCKVLQTEFKIMKFDTEGTQISLLASPWKRFLFRLATM